MTRVTLRRAGPTDFTELCQLMFKALYAEPSPYSAENVMLEKIVS